MSFLAGNLKGFQAKFAGLKSKLANAGVCSPPVRYNSVICDASSAEDINLRLLKRIAPSVHDAVVKVSKRSGRDTLAALIVEEVVEKDQTIGSLENGFLKSRLQAETYKRHLSIASTVALRAAGKLSARGLLERIEEENPEMAEQQPAKRSRGGSASGSKY